MRERRISTIASCETPKRGLTTAGAKSKGKQIGLRTSQDSVQVFADS